MRKKCKTEKITVDVCFNIYHFYLISQLFQMSGWSQEVAMETSTS